MIRLMAIADFTLAVATSSAEATPFAPLPHPDSIVTQIVKAQRFHPRPAEKEMRRDPYFYNQPLRELLTMMKYLRAAAIAVPAALLTIAPVENANANPMVAVGWVWAAGLGGLALGFLAGNAYAQHNVVVAAEPVPAATPTLAGYRCRPGTIRSHGTLRHVMICE